MSAACARLGKPTLSITAKDLARLEAHPWPGNVRELHNVIERAVILANSETIQPADLPEQFAPQPDARIAVGSRVTLDELEAEHIKRVIASARNLDEAARTLGIDPATLYRKRQRLGLP